MPDTHLILHVKGTEQETASLPKQVVRAAISQGQITHSQLIWSPLHNAWKQVRELPQLWPSQKLAPAPPPTQRAGTVKLPPVSEEEQPRSNPKPRVATPGVRARPVAVGGTEDSAVVSAQRAPEASLVVKEEHGPNPFKWICGGLGALILLILALNYFLVDRPLQNSFGKTAYAKVTVFAHLGAFMQPNVVVIHIPASSAITDDTMTDFLVALAGSTPEAPFGSNDFERVALTSGWTGTYSFSGYAWKQLGEMAHDGADQRKEFVLDQMMGASGEPLVAANPNLTDEARQAQREKVWIDFVAQFAHR